MRGKRLFAAYISTTGILAVVIAALIIRFMVFAPTVSAAPAQPQRTSVLSCIPLSDTQFTPVGVTWKLTVYWLTGQRAGHSETSLMTFQPGGSLTATFPGATPLDPPTLPPATDGKWCMTGMDTFSYSFHDNVMQNGKLIGYVLPKVNAHLLNKKTYEAGGVGVLYLYQAGKLVPSGQSAVTRTAASCMDCGG